ncbi:glucan endo-1,3-beta-D-glucosidase [Catenovulum agarivorans DS-2]|uniref:Glucan endo-1,3-beta-D-glucosidase n=1 Tax=Catenovulum agarivorans DS-2 TaxID=1328313 RepID=W7QCG4_9ALTE|nr:family 16 glycosylhydrolase [Catenovulum agarivorans]EWH10579.1 glucan endo-1,3-beta-D-glucosidase [Catenovulum agarivorans DS-2]
MKKPSIKTTTAVLAVGLFSATSYANTCQTLVWSDEFNGTTLDLNNWEVQTGDGCAEGICGWGNNELQSYQSDNLTVANGTLTITAKKQRVQANSYTSGRIRTAGMPASGEWTNGRFEARIKLPDAAGMWPAFWMLPTNPDVGWPMSGEIDIMESTGQASMFAHGTIHYGEAWPNNSFTGAHVLSQPQKWSDNFHVYAVEWEPNEIRWYVDGMLYSTKTPSDLANPSWWTYENYQYHILLNMAVGGSWGGTVDDSALPATMEVDYVRVYNLGEAAIDGPNIVAPNSTHTFTVVGAQGTNSSYTWSAPAGATISGSGESVNIDFAGATSGEVSVTVTNASCGTDVASFNVFVEPELAVETVLDDFDGNSAVTYTYFDGNFDVSGGVLNYTRNSATQWDVIAASTSAISNAAPLLVGDKAFAMDLFNTDAALVGKQILVQLENSATATSSNYPVGRHSKYEAFIDHANGRQTLRFRLADRIDGDTGDTNVDTLVILIDPNTFNGDLYTIDNFVILGGSTQPPAEATSVYVSSVTTGTQSAGKGQKFGTAAVTVLDDLGQPYANASVTGSFNGTWDETQTVSTDVNGVANFVTSTSQGGGVTVNFCVSDVTAALTFDTSASTGLCQ